MPRRPRTRTSVALAGTALAAATWGATALADLRRIRADPQHDLLRRRPEGGEPHTVTGRGGARLHVECFGPEDGPVVVLLHGWVCELAFWTRQIAGLRDTHRLVVPDLRGHGRSERPADGDHSIEALADDLELVLEALVPEGRPAVLAGHSMGAMTIAAWADRHREQLRGRAAAVALVNTGLGDLVSDALVVKTPDGLGALRTAFGTVVMSAKVPLPPQPTPISHRLVHHVALGPDASPAQIAFCERMVLTARPGTRGGFGGTLSRLDLLHAVEHLDVPALVVAGEADRLTPPVHAERLHERLPQPLGLDVRPRIGHMAPVEDADHVTGRLRDLAARYVTAAAPA